MIESVDDQATGLLMRSFYTHLKRGLSKEEALRAAQPETRRLYPNPYYWAGFVLTGDAGPAPGSNSASHSPRSPRHERAAVRTSSLESRNVVSEPLLLTRGSSFH